MLLLTCDGIQAQGTAFTYQGQLSSKGGAANGSFDLTFTLFTINNGGTSAIATITNSATTVSNGLFLATLDFGTGVFYGANYWLELGVRTNGGGSFTILGPRQPVTPSPYAIFAGTANTAGTVSGSVNATQLSGTVANNQLAHNAIMVTAGTGLGGGGAVALGGAITLNNAGVTGVTGNADITAATLGGTVTLGDTATSANSADTIIKRDDSGNFSAGTATFTGPVYLSNPQNNTGVGSGVLANNTTGIGNTAIGFQALYHNSFGNNNLGLGALAGYNLTTGSSNIDIGNSGLATDANLIRIGSGQSQTYLAGALAVNGATVVDASGHWVGSSTGLVGPQGPAGPAGATGATGSIGPQGPQGVAGAAGTNGVAGAPGPQGPQGLQGAVGPAGTNGNTIWHGTGAPASALGTNGDFYINTSVESLYGPKTSGSWGGGVSLIGPQGATGPPGSAGTNGNTILSGSGTPAFTLGVAGDFYLNTSVPSLYGPKTASSWGSGVSLVGPQGPAGVAGSTGPAGSQGPAGPGSTLESLGIKTGSVTGSVSAQGVANLTVTFTTAFANANYAIMLTPKAYSFNSTQISVNAFYNSKSASGFTVNLVTDLLVSSPPAITCDWSAIPYNNP